MPTLLKNHLAVIPRLPTSFQLWHLQLYTLNGIHENEVAKSRCSLQRCSVRKSGLRNFAKFTGKHLCQGLYFNKVFL